MRSLEEHNTERLELFAELLDAMKPQPNGIACPACGLELWDSDPGTTLTSNPPQKNIHCSCGYSGYRIA